MFFSSDYATLQARTINRLSSGCCGEFPPMRIAGFKSEVLVIGGVPEEGDVVLLKPDGTVKNGTPVA
jgi:hypothetical protein